MKFTNLLVLASAITVFATNTDSNTRYSNSTKDAPTSIVTAAPSLAIRGANPGNIAGAILASALHTFKHPRPKPKPHRPKPRPHKPKPHRPKPRPHRPKPKPVHTRHLPPAPAHPNHRAPWATKGGTDGLGTDCPVGLNVVMKTAKCGNAIHLVKRNGMWTEAEGEVLREDEML